MLKKNNHTIFKLFKNLSMNPIHSDQSSMAGWYRFTS